MAIYFQHVGEAGAKRDFPKTIGEKNGDVVRFNFDDISDFIDGYSDEDIADLKLRLSTYSPDGFQIWGIPSGAKSVLKNFSSGDTILLLETITEGGSFGFAGRAVELLRAEQFRLSQRLWGEARFPLIIFLDGGMTDFSWFRFCEEFGYKTNWNPAGNTYEVKKDRIELSSFTSEQDVLNAFLPSYFNRRHLEGDVLDEFLDSAEIDSLDEEGFQILREHLIRERSSRLVREFKKSLSEIRCTVCGFDFFATYGDLGRGFIEAHHIEPLSETKHPKKTSIKDLVAVCSNCHRMLHRKYPSISANELTKILSKRMLDRMDSMD